MKRFIRNRLRSESGIQFDESYREDVVLWGETRIRVRLVRPSDKKRFVEGFERLSPRSRYLRFLRGKGTLSASELRYLTELDLVNHVALGAVRLSRFGREGDGVGVARFVRLPEEPEVAEFAVTVVDAMQGLGIGRLLIRRLAAAAMERGIVWFRCWLLPENERMRDVLALVAPSVAFRTDGSSLRAEFCLSAVKNAHGEP
jgi:GNAT superfamily N-acetyltransferase